MIIATSCYENAEIPLLKAAGIGWVRMGFPYPFRGPGNEQTEFAPRTPFATGLTPAYLQARQEARRWAERGFKLIASTPGLGLGVYQPDANGKMSMTWRGDYPAWFGAPGSEAFYRQYAQACAFLAKDMGEIAPLWQIANEIDWPQFAGPFDLRQASELALRAMIAIKEVNPDLLVGTNSAGAPTSYYFFGRLYADPRLTPDYCGIDQYYGTWQPGGPETWDERITELAAITGGVKILINEWGYSSAGEVMNPAEAASEAPNCQLRKWRHAWGAGHTGESQAEYIRRAFEVFVAHRPQLLGVCFYRWEDQASCWQCGAADCPVETAWGLVDRQGRPKPSYYAFQEGVQRLTA